MVHGNTSRLCSSALKRTLGANGIPSWGNHAVMQSPVL
ncbi:hypothetical protein H5410_062306, partial [Solanum commersonii]